MPSPQKALSLLGAMLLTLALAAGCAQDGETRWGVYQEPVAPLGLPEAAGASELTVLWQKNLGGGADRGYAILKPAYAGGGVYAASRGGVVYKLDPADGETIWQRDVGAEIFSGVGVGGGGNVAVAAVALDDGTVLALEAATGELLWEVDLQRQISAAPVAGGGRVIARTADGLVAGLDAADGAVVWSFTRAAPGLSVHGDSPPVISGNAVLIGLANGRLLANDVRSGREYWETEVSFVRGRNELERLSDSDTAPLVAANTVYTATYQGNVAALRLQDATVKWKAKVSSRLPMSLGGGRLLVTSELGEVVAMDAETGAIRWTREDFRGHGMSRPLVVGNRVVVGDAGGNVHSLDLADGALLETRKAVDGAVVALIPGERQFAVFSSEGDLAALALEAGR